jgi:hypothetical protein
VLAVYKVRDGGEEEEDDDLYAGLAMLHMWKAEARKEIQMGS